MNLELSLQEIIQNYNTVIKEVDQQAKDDDDRAYGGVVRFVKGKLQERITERLIELAWKSLGGRVDSLEINPKPRKIPIPIKSEYISRIDNQEVRNHIKQNISNYIYNLSVDHHVFINKQFVIGVECKAYTENAMLKRILVDFSMIRLEYPDLSCYLFQLESQLGGDYSKEIPLSVYGSFPTHTILSYFSYTLNIVTLLQGERKPKQPIHKFYKPLEMDVLRNAVEILKEDMKRFL